MSKRSLKVSDFLSKRVASRDVLYPKLVVKGRWLSLAGFQAGDHVDVEVQENRIVISKQFSR